MFETFEESGKFFLSGTVYVIAILDRNTLTLRDYADTVFVEREEAEEALERILERGFDYDTAHVIQAKYMKIPIHGEDA